MTADIEVVKGFKSKFLSFFLDATEKEQVSKSFDSTIDSLSKDQLKKAAFYADMYNKGNTDSEKIYFSEKTAKELKPFFKKGTQ